jgi:hypothetical protein
MATTTEKSHPIRDSAIYKTLKFGVIAVIFVFVFLLALSAAG